MSEGCTSSAESAAEQKRSATRDSIFLLGVIRHRETGELYTARVRNLSATGLMAEGVTGVLPATPVTVEMRGLGTVPGAVVWCEADRIGIHFAVEVDPLRARKSIAQRPSLRARHAP